MATNAQAISTVAFTMHGAREAIAGGIPHIQEQVKAIEQAVAGNAGLTFDLAKTLIESACKTILTDRQKTFGDTDELPKLFKLVTSMLPFLPPGAVVEGSIRKSLGKTLGGLSTALHGVCELRNDCGFASHGKDGPSPVLETMQAMLVAQAADAIVGFIYRAHMQAVAGPPAPTLEYEDNPDFNAAIDERNGGVFLSFGSGEDEYVLAYDASRLLFDSDLEAYRNELENFKSALATQTPATEDAVEK